MSSTPNIIVSITVRLQPPLSEPPVKLFFYRNGKKGYWNALLSINTALNAYEAYKRAIEVSFADDKRLLNLGKCQCRNFASQIASISLCMLQYNILGYVKRYH